MYQEVINHGGVNYQRLSVPGESTWGEPGLPAIPCISNLTAIPECVGHVINIVVHDSLVFDSINLYPVPVLVYDSNGYSEQFYKNDTLYAGDTLLPVNNSDSKSGYLRAQKFLNVFTHAFKYNPQQQILIVYTDYSVAITFQNPTTSVNVDNGYFNQISKNALINFNSDNIPSIPAYPPPVATSVTWKTLNSCNDADQIVADYLIITHDQFFTPHSMALQRLANHKATLNGFDVVIVNVSNILDPNFGWTIEPGEPRLNAEKKIREFIRRVYANGTAHHTYDGSLAFVCLVGDADDDGFETHVPASHDHNPTGKLDFGQVLGYLAYNDYYYSCLTRGNDPDVWDWDLVGDLFIGRISVRTDTELNNYVAKLKHNENEFTNQSWRRNNTLCYGGSYSLTNSAEEHAFGTSELKNYLTSICPFNFHTEIVDAIPYNTMWNEEYKSFLNIDGANIVVHYGHGVDSEWSFLLNAYTPFALSNEYKINNLSNFGKYPIALSNSCYSGAYLGAVAGGGWERY